MTKRTIRVHYAGALSSALLLGLAALPPEPVAAQPSGGQDRGDRSSPPTLTVAGNAEVSVDPDRAVVRLGVVAQAPEAGSAQEQVNRIMQQVLAAVTRLDVSEQAVRTEELSLFPVYSELRPFPAQAEPEEPRITGYRASNVVSVELDDLSKIGDVIDAGLGAGANQLQGISFEIRDDAAARARALREAVQDARAEADAVAEAMGMQIEGVREVVAGRALVRPPVPYGARFDASELAATPVQPGQVDVSASVTVTYYVGGGGPD